jgi:hypothetical protein
MASLQATCLHVAGHKYPSTSAAALPPVSSGQAAAVISTHLLKSLFSYPLKVKSSLIESGNGQE